MPEEHVELSLTIYRHNVRFMEFKGIIGEDHVQLLRYDGRGRLMDFVSRLPLDRLISELEQIKRAREDDRPGDADDPASVDSVEHDLSHLPLD